MPRRVDSLLVDSRMKLQIANHRRGKSQIIDVVVQRVPAAPVAGVPGQQPVRQWACAVRVNNQKALPIGDAIELGVSLEAGRIPAATVKGQENRQGRIAGARRHVNDVRTLSTTMADRELVIARGDGGALVVARARRAAGGTQREDNEKATSCRLVHFISDRGLSSRRRAARRNPQMSPASVPIGPVKKMPSRGP